ncbi:hypothetical protein SZN_11753 [Streptomyces zinciresistens K42]|uniref:Uncharacterized protein n=1 Tax=Streptomyces zinciresistens K42 TaxID=700597 RepID=G2GA30_9ACTN|nr:hypothetical protein [Streptomyces zinciresistens]EGX59622.1 hypothetical protein SZN_11753 [Streptomyces zinciresistens K42]
MKVVRGRASRTPSLLRGRLALFLLLLTAAGSPWAQRPLREYFLIHYIDGEPTRSLLMAAFTPAWEYRAFYYGGAGYLFGNLVAALVLFTGIALLPALLPARLPVWLRCLAAGVLVTEACALFAWAVPELFRPDARYIDFSGEVLADLMRSGLLFGLAAGLLLALLSAGPAGPYAASSAGAATAPARRRREGGPGMTTAPVRTPVGSEPGDVTRYLCAAAHLDEDFADRVVDEVLADEAGAVAPSPDVDLVAVVRHSLAARDLRQRRDLRLAAAFAAVAVLAPLWLLAVATVPAAARRAASDARSGLATRGHRQPGHRALVAAGVSAALALLILCSLAVSLPALSPPGFAGWLLGAYLGGVPAVLAAVGATAFAYAAVVRHDLDTDLLLRTTMTREAFPRRPRPSVPQRKWIAERLKAVREAQTGNVTVYSGFSPFVGYANTRSTWSVAVPLLPAGDPAGQRRDGPRAFTVPEIVDHVRERLRSVAARGVTGEAAGDGGEALGALVVEDRVFASGVAVGDDERFVKPARPAPAARLSPEEVERIMLSPTGAVRHYLSVHVPLWGGDVVPSVFLHFSTAGRTLHLHCDNHALGPVRAAYHAVDRLRGPLGPGARRGLLLDAMARTGGALLASPVRVLRYVRFETRHSRRAADELKAREQDPVYDHGARVSIREMALSPDYHNYFQVVDAGRVTALAGRHALAAIREFLDARGYDTTDFRAQQQTILNQGVIQQGGTSIVGNQAIGSGAHATQHIPQQSGPAAQSAAAGSDT